MKFSYSAVWDDLVRLIREHGSLLAAIAGVFIFLPAVLLIHFLPTPEARAATPEAMVRTIVDYYSMIWPWLLLQGLISMIGSIAMLRLIFARGTSVGQALVFGLTLLPFYFLMSLLGGLAIALGFILLIVPGLYLIGRVAPAGAVMVAEERRNPIEALTRSFQITKGHGWAVLGLILVVAIAGLIAMSVLTSVLGILFILVAGQDLGGLLTKIVSSATNAAFATLLVVLYAAIYRALAEPDSAARTAG